MTKRQYYNESVHKCAGDQGALFSIINKLLCHASSSPLPSAESNAVLADKFSNYFFSKISKIQDGLNSQLASTNTVSLIDERKSPFLLEAFESVCAFDISKLIASYLLKACPPDPIPAKVLKWVICNLSPVIASLVNLSLQTGIMPQQLNEAMISPILKKSHLDPEYLSNYRLVSNLPFVSKVIERVVAAHITAHMDANCLMEPLQSE